MPVRLFQLLLWLCLPLQWQHPPCLWLWLLPLGPWHLNIQLFPMHLGFSVQWLYFQLWKSDHRRTLKVAGVLTNLFITVIMKSMSSGLSQCEWVGLRWQIHSNIPVSLGLTLTLPLHSGLLTVGHFLVYFSQPTKQTIRALSNFPSCNIKDRISVQLAHVSKFCLDSILCSLQHYPILNIILTHVPCISVCINLYTDK